MLVITLFEQDGEHQFRVHDVSAGEDAPPIDVTDEFRVNQLTVQDGDDEFVAGWHIGRLVSEAEKRWRKDR